MMMSDEKDHLRCFLESVFSGLPPPEDPFVRSKWIGAAFDRNRYEQLAPTEWWRALTACSSFVLGEDEIFVIERDSSSTLKFGQIIAIANSEYSIFEHLDMNENFLRDQYLIGKSLRWACLLDQDVSLFGGDNEFMLECFNQVGGRQYLLAKMRDDFIGGKSYSDNPLDKFTLDFERYFKRLLWGSKRGSVE